MIRQQADPEAPSRSQYRLTRKGVEYYPVLLMLMIWGDRYYASPEGAPVAPSGPAPGSGPDGNTHRLLTVVKSGSIQDTKATPGDKVHVWPHLLVAEFLAAIIITLFTTVFSIFVNAPLLELADFNKTPNPSKAPWYFLGLQELLTMFHPMVAGVTIPGIGLFLLMMAPYIDKNPSKKPEDRKFAVSLMPMTRTAPAARILAGHRS